MLELEVNWSSKFAMSLPVVKCMCSAVIVTRKGQRCFVCLRVLCIYQSVRKKCFYHVVYKWMESNVCNFCIVTNCVCKMSFEMTKAVVMSARVVDTNCIYSMQFSCLMIQYKTSPVCVCYVKVCSQYGTIVTCFLWQFMLV